MDTLFQEIAFWAVTVVAVGAALLVVTVRDVFRAALFLVVAFLGVAGLFVLLNAEFLAVVQVLIYAGAISILIIFAIMLTRDVQRGNRPTPLRPLALTASALLLAAFVYAIVQTDWRLLEETRLAASTAQGVTRVWQDTPRWLGGLLMREFLLPFEAAAVLLLAAVVGALVLVRER